MNGFGISKFIAIITLLTLVNGAVSIASAQESYEPMELIVSCEISTRDYFWRLIVRNATSPNWNDVIGEWIGGVNASLGAAWEIGEILTLAGNNARYLRGDRIRLNGWAPRNSEIGYAEILVLRNNRVIYSEYVEIEALIIPAICGEPINA
ncbi:MAG: hypothetical protein ACUVS2_06720 [Candidatus Flexifilum sp.]